MSKHDAHDAGHDVSKDIKVYVLIFVALLIGTVITVAVSYIPDEKIPFGHAGVITLGMIIASVKAFLVAGWFMHLMSERTLIYTILIFTVFFFAGMMFLTLYASYDIPMIKE